MASLRAVLLVLGVLAASADRNEVDNNFAPVMPHVDRSVPIDVPGMLPAGRSQLVKVPQATGTATRRNLFPETHDDDDAGRSSGAVEKMFEEEARNMRTVLHGFDTLKHIIGDILGHLKELAAQPIFKLEKAVRDGGESLLARALAMQLKGAFDGSDDRDAALFKKLLDNMKARIELGTAVGELPSSSGRSWTEFSEDVEDRLGSGPIVEFETKIKYGTDQLAWFLGGLMEALQTAQRDLEKSGDFIGARTEDFKKVMDMVVSLLKMLKERAEFGMQASWSPIDIYDSVIGDLSGEHQASGSETADGAGKE